MECLQENEIKPISITLDNAIYGFSAVLTESVITDESNNLLQIDDALYDMLNMLNHCRYQNGTIYIVGNGGSASIASHAVIDFLNMAKTRANALLDCSVTTCLSNDYGYEQVYAKQLLQFMHSEDVLIAISSSGRSQNIINAVNVAKKISNKIITLSGFSKNNSLCQLGTYNLWLNSTDYGQVEIGHAFILHYLTDRLRDCINEDVI